MGVRVRDETGDTLLEIILAIVIIGLVVGAFFATYATQGSGSTAHRTLVTADGVLRGYAEATKSAVRDAVHKRRVPVLRDVVHTAVRITR